MNPSCGFVRDLLLYAITDMGEDERRRLFEQEAPTILASMSTMLADTIVRLIREANSIADAGQEIEKLEDARRLISEISRLMATKGRQPEHSNETSLNLTA